MSTADAEAACKDQKPLIVVSGVNVREVGALSIFRDALSVLAQQYANRYRIMALVKDRRLFDVAGVAYLEFPHISRSWLSRIRFEYWSARKISDQWKPWFWLSIHDTTPNVRAEIRAVYCHNASPFYRMKPAEFMLDRRFGMFTLFYQYLYRINIHANQYVIVQQEWMRKEFERLFGIKNVVVAHPELYLESVGGVQQERGAGPYRFFYPMFPRTYKNPEVALHAARVLKRRGFHDFELWLTFDSKTNRYAASVVEEFGNLNCVRWLGVLPRERVYELYGEADCLLFPSRLETWGLPISEFRSFGKPILAADLPYAHETASGYERVSFFDPKDAEALAEMMMRAAKREPIFEKVPEIEIAAPFSRNWSELWRMMLG